MQAGLKKAIAVPLGVARSVSKLWDTTKELASIINIGARADLQVGTHSVASTSPRRPVPKLIVSISRWFTK